MKKKRTSCSEPLGVGPNGSGLVRSKSLLSPRSLKNVAQKSAIQKARDASHPMITKIVIQQSVERWLSNSPNDDDIVSFEKGKFIGAGGSGCKVYECQVACRVHEQNQRVPQCTPQCVPQCTPQCVPQCSETQCVSQCAQQCAPRQCSESQCAVKYFCTAKLTDSEIGQIRNEIKIMKQLPKHPTLVCYKGFIESDDRICIFMSKHDESLYNFLENNRKKSTKLSLQQIIKFCIDVLTAISLLHRNNIVHRDIKSANVFLNRNAEGEISHLTVGDFDIAKKIILDGKAKTCVGTPMWIAPEVLCVNELEKKTYDNFADIWSFGMLLYEMITCNMPYHHLKNKLQASMYIANGQLPKFTLEEQEIYKPITKYFTWCCEKNSERRPSSDSLLEEFQNLLI